MDRKTESSNHIPSLGRKKTAVVVGASLAGLMTGIALADTGRHVMILERSGPHPRKGAGLQVGKEETEAAGTAEKLRRLAAGESRAVQAWSLIHSRLYKEAERNRNISFHFNTCVATAGQNESCAWVHTNDGREFCGELVVGADGHRSIIRRYVDPEKPDARFAGYLVWVALLKESEISPKHWLSGEAPPVSRMEGRGDFLLGSLIADEGGSGAPGHRLLGLAWYDHAHNEVLHQTGCVQDGVVRHSLNGPEIPEPILRELAVKAKESWPEPWLDAVLYSIRTRSLVGTPIAEYLPERLVNGRLAIVGDAAHVLTPIIAAGFHNALQDAAVLADCIAAPANTSVFEALLAYESHCLKRARRAVRAGHSFSRRFGR